MESTHWDPDFLEEVKAEESPLDPAYPLRGKPLGPARVAGRLVRYALEDLKELGRIWDRAKQGKATLMDSITGAMAGINPSSGPGFGAGPRIKAAPWQSRTLDAILGESPVGKKFPNAATPQVWESKLRGAGLPKDEVEKVSKILALADPNGKVDRIQLATLAEHPMYLPTLGVTRTELGGPMWEAAQKRINYLTSKLHQAKDRVNELRGNTAGPEADKVISEYKGILAEHSKLSQWAADKRPGWPEKPQYNIEELKSPREFLYHARPMEGGEYSNADMRIHYPGRDKNLLFHQREGVLEFLDGKKSTHISEQQSDWISEASASKNMIRYRDPESGFITVPKKEIKIRAADDGTYYIDAYGNFDGHYTKEEAEKILAGRLSPIEDVPKPPMKDNWWKMGLKDAVKRAVEEGHDYLTWDTPETIVQRGGDKIKGVAEHHYGNNVPGFFKKEYGVEAERVAINSNTKPVFAIENEAGELIQFPANRIRIGETMSGEFVGIAPNGMWVTEPLPSMHAVDAVISSKTKDVPTQEVFRIPITEEIIRKVLLEGQYFSKRTAKPGGRDAEGVA